MALGKAQARVPAACKAGGSMHALEIVRPRSLGRGSGPCGLNPQTKKPSGPDPDGFNNTFGFLGKRLVSGAVSTDILRKIPGESKYRGRAMHKISKNSRRLERRLRWQHALSETQARLLADLILQGDKR